MSRRLVSNGRLVAVITYQRSLFAAQPRTFHPWDSVFAIAEWHSRMRMRLSTEVSHETIPLTEETPRDRR